MRILRKPDHTYNGAMICHLKLITNTSAIFVIPTLVTKNKWIHLCVCVTNTIYPIISEMYFVGKVSSLSKISTYMYKIVYYNQFLLL